MGETIPAVCVFSKTLWKCLEALHFNTCSKSYVPSRHRRSSQGSPNPSHLHFCVAKYNAKNSSVVSFNELLNHGKHASSDPTVGFPTCTCSQKAEEWLDFPLNQPLRPPKNLSIYFHRDLLRKDIHVLWLYV